MSGRRAGAAPPPPAERFPDTFVACFPILGLCSPAHMKRQAVEQVARMPEAQNVRFHGEWAWSIVKAPSGRPTHLVGRISAATDTPPADTARAAAVFSDAIRPSAPGLAAWVDRQLGATP